MTTKITLHPAKEQIVVKQGDQELLIDLRDVKLKIIGAPTIEQMQAQPLALMTLVATMFRDTK